MDLPADPGLTLTAYTAEPASPSEDASAAARQLGRHRASTDAVEKPDPTPTSKDL